MCAFSFRILSADRIAGQDQRQDVADVLDKPYGHLTPLSGVDVQARQST